MPDAPAAGPGVPVCASDDLVERGDAHVFDVLHFGQPVTAFALRFDGRVVGYLNRCQHVPTEMDWQHGKFLDADREFILCAVHGATYEPVRGRCVGGPCGRGQLTPIELRESGGQVYWYPSRDIGPAFADEPGPAPESRP